MKHRNFYILAWLFSLIGVPMAPNLSLLIASSQHDYSFVLIFLPMPVIPLVFWYFTMRKANIPESASPRLAPIFASFFYYMAVWILYFGSAGYNFDNYIFAHFAIMASPYFVLNYILGAFKGGLLFFPLIQVIALFVNIAAYKIAAALNKKTFKREKAAYCYWAAALLLCLAAGWQHYCRPL
jgi:hypothetical protein